MPNFNLDVPYVVAFVPEELHKAITDAGFTFKVVTPRAFTGFKFLYCKGTDEKICLYISPQVSDSPLGNTLDHWVHRTSTLEFRDFDAEDLLKHLKAIQKKAIQK